MLDITKICKEKPYLKFANFYNQALNANQSNIEAISIASFSNTDKEVDSRFVNLKFVDNEEFIFFTNYESPKAIQFDSHNQISAVFFWSKINTQIRIKAKIKKLPERLSSIYFKNRSRFKNALAISSKQSNKIDSYEQVMTNYESVLIKNKDLTIRPNYWGGYAFKPYYFEFWKGHESRVNSREAFEKHNGKWHSFFLEP